LRQASAERPTFPAPISPDMTLASDVADYWPNRKVPHANAITRGNRTNILSRTFIAGEAEMSMKPQAGRRDLAATRLSIAEFLRNVGISHMITR
jgi:hypothetical protein